MEDLRSLGLDARRGEIEHCVHVLRAQHRGRLKGARKIQCHDVASARTKVPDVFGHGGGIVAAKRMADRHVATGSGQHLGHQFAQAARAADDERPATGPGIAFDAACQVRRTRLYLRRRSKECAQLALHGATEGNEEHAEPRVVACHLHPQRARCHRSRGGELERREDRVQARAHHAHHEGQPRQIAEPRRANERRCPRIQGVQAVLPRCDFQALVNPGLRWFIQRCGQRADPPGRRIPEIRRANCLLEAAKHDVGCGNSFHDGREAVSIMRVVHRCESDAVADIDRMRKIALHSPSGCTRGRLPKIQRLDQRVHAMDHLPSGQQPSGGHRIDVHGIEVARLRSEALLVVVAENSFAKLPGQFVARIGHVAIIAPWDRPCDIKRVRYGAGSAPSMRLRTKASATKPLALTSSTKVRR